MCKVFQSFFTAMCAPAPYIAADTGVYTLNEEFAGRLLVVDDYTS